ncbi:M48 family metallopeptidase [Nodosilinea sp. LEGE 07088]|uniref:M48 family metallopeptidase n=1 Tax=Nodosilinea sp. LEGE 07088 TaxID=2777968 RepID=UPI00187E63C9|nr:M48 family metallopeptidase [Nodosilinea sp. LEGE 07088]MBE9138568.1 M48 family metallopeptidase [Nodosilinea sp. LEGE 07088]
MTGKTLLVGLRADQFRHPLDLEATRALKQLPGLDTAVRMVLAPLAERFFHLDHLASSLQVSDRQLPDLYQSLVEACRILDLSVPQLYVRQNPVPNAYTFAMCGEDPFIVIHTALLELLTPAETQAVIAHELGHLKCEHSVYLTLANLITMAASQLPLGEVLAQNLQNQLMEWVRCAEFTCDRAALLVAQDPRIVASLMMKLCGGSPSLADQLNVDAFIDQARAYDAISTDALGDALKQMRTQGLTHPVPVLRAREIDRWASSPDYFALVKSRPDRYNGGSPKGEWRNW